MDSSAPALKRQRSAYGESPLEIPSHLIAVKDVSRNFLNHLLNEAEEMKNLVRTNGGDERLKHKVLASVFYEASTRTSCSFQAAMQRLGGTVICVNEQHSSAQKGETITDTAQTLACYCDAIVLRHPMKGAAALAVAASSKPVINAGDGTGEHPTQALLDAYTIKSELGHIGSSTANGPPMIVTLLGDLKHGRTVHSLVRLLSLFPGIKLNYIAPSSLAMPAEIIEEIDGLGVSQTSTLTLEEAIVSTDVLYVTRIQKERFDSNEDYESIANSYCVNTDLMKKAKQHMIVMHPLPRVNEISTDVDTDPRAAYFRQMEYGMYMRMAILSSMLLKRDV